MRLSTFIHAGCDEEDDEGLNGSHRSRNLNLKKKKGEFNYSASNASKNADFRKKKSSNKKRKSNQIMSKDNKMIKNQDTPKSKRRANNSLCTTNVIIVATWIVLYESKFQYWICTDYCEFCLFLNLFESCIFRNFS
eukprot:GHVR01012433.1.p1 GENE.GHVR01012433.1~~GHVR01012433.1.p1  ORF type:complete len:136 (+),score=9.33 GHVR01012433.1:530-937(+)